MSWSHETLGERWPLLLYPKGSRGKSARGTKNPRPFMAGSVSLCEDILLVEGAKSGK